MGVTPNDIKVIADALLLAHSLIKELRRDAVERTLREPLLVPEPAEIPSWLHVKRYLENHPEFLDSTERRAWWRGSLHSTADRVRLVREFTAAVTGQKGRGVALLTTRVARNGDAMARVSSRLDDILGVLANSDLRYSDRRQGIVSILTGRK